MKIENGVLLEVTNNDIKNGTFTIPESVTSIGDFSFDNCTSLKSITIPDSVTSIGYSAFLNCTSLESITIPGSVTSIGNFSFDNCTSLKSEKKIYKAFKPDLSCRDYQYEIGKWSDEIDYITICNKGYHYCTNLFDIFNYYYGEYGKDYIICECEVGNKVLTHNEDSKCCTNKIKPIRKLELNEVLNILNGGDVK